MRVWWSGFHHHVAVEPLDVARSKDLTNTPNWVYFGVFPVDLVALHVVVRAVVVLCRKSGETAKRELGKEFLLGRNSVLCPRSTCPLRTHKR